MPTLYLYRAYALDGALLYVGLAKNWAARWAAHSAKASWFRDVARLELSAFDNPDDAIAAERSAILAEAPRHNLRGGGGGIQGVDARGLLCPVCGCAYARSAGPLWLVGTMMPFSPSIDVGSICGDQSSSTLPCPGVLRAA